MASPPPRPRRSPRRARAPPFFLRGLLPSLTDLRLAVRVSLRTPVLSVTAILAMAAGIALATAAFTVVKDFFYATLRVPHGGRIVALRDYGRVERARS